MPLAVALFESPVFHRLSSTAWLLPQGRPIPPSRSEGLSGYSQGTRDVYRCLHPFSF